MATTAQQSEVPEGAADAAMGLDMVLVDAARGPLRRMVPPGSRSS
jgi:polyhydroxyalkanoate synthase